MTPHEIEALFGLLAAVALLAWGARTVGVPYPIVLVLGGVGLGFLPGLPTVTVDPQVVFLVFLPPLVHAAAYTASPRALREEAIPIGVLAFPLVALTIAAVAVVAHALVGSLTWPAAVALGAIVAPTDPVAASAVFRRLGVPERLVGVVEGESLLNDASGLVAYRVAVAAIASGAFSLLEAAGDLVVVSAGGLVAGVAVAWIASQLRRRLEDSLIEITVTLLTPYLAYIVAEALGVSGVLAAVVSGVILGRQAHELFSPGTRLAATAFWSVLTFLLETTLFILIGLQFPQVVKGIDGAIVVAAAAVAATVIVVRLAFSLVGLRGFALRERLVIGWTGMRGAVSLAAALALPVAAVLPQRNALIFVTLVVIGATLVLQGLTLPAVARWAISSAPPPDARQYALARFQTVEAALDRVGELSLTDDVPPPRIERARSLYTERASQLAGECRTGIAEEDTDTAAWLRLRLDLLAVERAALIDLRDRGEIPNMVMLGVEHELDLEESRLRARAPAA